MGSKIIRTLLHGITAELDATPGYMGLLAYDSDLRQLRLYDGVSLGGYPIVRSSDYMGLPGMGITVSTGGGAVVFSVDGTVVRTIRQIIAGVGLAGGGDLSADVNLAMGTPSSLTATSTNSATGTTHTHAIDATIARAARQVIAGVGMTGGGDLTADRTLTMGTPSAVTGSSTNSVTGTTHTHAFDITCLTTKLYSATFAVGTIILGKPIATGTNYAFGATLVGASVMALTDINNFVGATITQTATWTCLGTSQAGSGTLWIRTA